MSSKRLRDAQWCPLCGVKAIQRDPYRLTHTNRRGKKKMDPRRFEAGQAPEFVCNACGAAFQLSPSMRHQQATSLIASERRQGPTLPLAE